MSDRNDDTQISRWRRRLRAAQQELAEVRQRGEVAAPLLDGLAVQLEQNQFAARFLDAVTESRRDK